MPQEARLRAKSKLLQSEWNVPIQDDSELDGAKGVCLWQLTETLVRSLVWSNSNNSQQCSHRF
eukprot:1087477-Amphidinium_carterae.1